MKNALVFLVTLSLSMPAFAAKWNQLTGDELRAMYDGTVMSGHYKGNKFTIHNCVGAERSIVKYQGGKKKTVYKPTLRAKKCAMKTTKVTVAIKFFSTQKKPAN